MPSFVYRLRDAYERTETEEDGAASNIKPSPPPVHLTQRVDGDQQPAAIALPASFASSQPPTLLYSCCYAICFIPCLLLSAIRLCCRAVRRDNSRANNRTGLVVLTSLLSALITVLMIAALAQDRFAYIHYTAPLVPADATLGSFRYCFSPFASHDSPTCHAIGRHCSAGGHELAALVGHRGESVTCDRFEAFRAFFLLAFLASLSSPIVIALHLWTSHWRQYALTVGVAVVEAVCALLSLVFFLPLLPPSSASAPATSRLASSFWLQFSCLLFALTVAALTSYGERQRRSSRWRSEVEPRSDQAETESVMAAAARKQGKPATEMATTATAGTAAAERLEEGVVVSGVFALGSDVELDLDNFHGDSCNSDTQHDTRDTETVSDVEREYALAAEQRERECESDAAGSGREEEKETARQPVEMHTVGLASAHLDRDSGEAAAERKTTASNRLP